MTKPTEIGNRLGMLEVTGYTSATRNHPATILTICECGGDYQPRKSLLAGPRGQHCGCIYALPPEWGDVYPRKLGDSHVFRAWLNLPVKDKCQYLDLVSTYSGIHRPTGLPLPPPSGMALRDPEKPATFENIEVFYCDRIGESSLRRSFDDFQLGMTRWKVQGPRTEAEPPQETPPPTHSQSTPDSLDW